MFTKVGVLSVFIASLTVGCSNQVNFAGKNSSPSLPGIEIPNVTPVPVPPPPAVEVPEVPLPVIPPALQLKAGTCSVQGEKVLTCLDCQSTADIPAPPILSRKAQELWDIMTVACSIPNKSDPVGYVAPTREQLLNRLVQCSPTAYPDTAFVNTQKITIEALLTNAIAQKAAFGGLYYNAASTDFETYFGLDIGEARYTYCRGQRTFNMGGVYPKEYYDSLYDGTYYQLPQYWVRAQKIREDLRGCMAKSLSDPNVTRPPATPGVTCTYETAEGEMSSLIVEQAQKWLDLNQPVYFEGFNMCGEMDYPESLLDQRGPVKIATKVCQ